MRFTVNGYKRHLCRELTSRALRIAVARARDQARPRRA
jgi:hypothetical protein